MEEQSTIYNDGFDHMRAMGNMEVEKLIQKVDKSHEEHTSHLKIWDDVNTENDEVKKRLQKLQNRTNSLTAVVNETQLETEAVGFVNKQIDKILRKTFDKPKDDNLEIGGLGMFRNSLYNKCFSFFSNKANKYTPGVDKLVFEMSKEFKEHVEETTYGDHFQSVIKNLMTPSQKHFFINPRIKGFVFKENANFKKDFKEKIDKSIDKVCKKLGVTIDPDVNPRTSVNIATDEYTKMIF